MSIEKIQSITAELDSIVADIKAQNFETMAQRRALFQRNKELSRTRTALQMAMFSAETIKELTDWTFNNFNLDVYRPSDANVEAFIKKTLLELVNCKEDPLPYDASADTIINDYCLNEFFNDFFLD